MTINIQTLGDIQKYLKKELSSIYPQIEIKSIANIITRTLFNRSSLTLETEPGFRISAEESGKLSEIIAQLKKGKPIQYILGETVFFDCPIKLNSSVLIPRQETEELVDLILRENRNFNGKIIDIGTGSGCIAIALAKNLPGSHVYAMDISQKAIDIAKVNAMLNKVKIEFAAGDILKQEIPFLKKYDIIVSNPPYVRESEKNGMHVNVLDYEPHDALFVPDNDPLLFYRNILQVSGSYLFVNGRVYFEINEASGDMMMELARDYKFKEIKVLKDLNGKDRIFKGIFNG
jgi:release factor glutamine methyltransferase